MSSILMKLALTAVMMMNTVYLHTPTDVIVNSMTLDEKIGQMFIAGFHGPVMNKEITDLIQNEHLGGVILYSQNIQSSTQLLSLVNNLKKTNINTLPLFISTDEEGGRVSRLPAGKTAFPPSFTIGKHNNKALAYRVGNAIGKEMGAYGFNLNFAPDFDIYTNPNNTVIGNRSFGTTPDIVSSLGTAAMKGLQDSHVIPTIKHFPGHGDTAVDSHIGLPIVRKTKQQLYKTELKPFQAAIKNGADMVMVAHIQYPYIDSAKPASLSKTLITGLLRDELGFDGVVITDDLEMGAISSHFGIETAVVDAVQAGVDLLLFAHTYETEKKAIHAIKQAVQNGKISEERIDESVRRIVHLKLKYNLTDQPLPADSLSILGCPAHQAVLNEILKSD
ncbi:beta-N-acetylhexosaminidase [Bacillus sp. 165]|uniref:beta-N-acetylhexosaminidase n=1 Tax=Bacillus sp. 165 TaxID=1529117 RepID=UPI001ADBA85E|nr:beta-N-acetylhexosaminidase [Bacillus sp. 165]MBO9130764.1 beta-N-acetylhexosaminidase [Bacillus sp. 165]